MYDDAAKTVKSYDGIEIPKTINPSEKDFYHLMAIITEVDLRSKKFYFKTKIVKLTVQGYERHKRSYTGLAEEDWIMFHNPLK